MSGSEAESRKATQEARRDAPGRATQPGAGNRHDALLRYLRGLYARPMKEPHIPANPKTEPTDE